MSDSHPIPMLTTNNRERLRLRSVEALRDLPDAISLHEFGSGSLGAPDMDSIEHMMIGEILGLLRYTKARRRHHDLLCWKFLSAITNRVLEVEYLAPVDRDRGLGKPLNRARAQAPARGPADT